MNIYLTILLEFLLISSSILLLFKYRKTLGLAPLYLFLGAVQYLQAFSGTIISFVVLGEITIYPSSVIVFSAILFAVLLIYIKEGVYSTRALIIGIIISNFLLSALFSITYEQQLATQNLNEIEASSVFLINYKYFITGTILLLIDFVLLVIIYQFLISKITKLNFFLTLFISLLLVLIFDAVVFNITLNYGSPDFNRSLIGHIIGKSTSALVFSFILYIYLKYIDNEKRNTSFIPNQDRDIFSIIKYSKKYLDINIEKKLVSQIETTLNNISDGFVSLDTNWCYTYVNIKAGEFLGRSAESLIGKHIWTEFPEGVGLPFYDVYYKAIETKETQYFEEYYEPFDKWFENRIYPSPDGLTIYFTDITEKKKAETNNQMLRSLIETSDDFIGLATLEGNPIYLNTNGKKLVGLEAGLKKEISISEFFPENYQDKIVNEHLPNIFENNKWNGESVFQNFKTGNLIPIEMSGFLIKDSSTNNPIALGIVAKDVTERKKAEENLIKSEQLFRGLTANAPVAIFQTDKEGVCNFVNEEWIKFSGLSFNESMGYGWSSAIHPEDRDRVVNEWQESILTENVLLSEYRLVHKNGEIAWLSSKTVALFDANNELYGYIGTLIDITEIKKAEAQLIESEKYLDTIINNIADPVFVKDEQSYFVLANDAFCAIFNLSREDIIGKTLAENVSPEEIEMFLRIDKQVIATGIENVNEETLTLSENEMRTISTKKTRFVDSSGNKYLVGVIRDITDKKKAEIQLIESEQYLNNIINNIGDPVFVKDSQSHLLLVNDAFCSIFNLSREDIIGKTLAENVPPEEEEIFLGKDKQVISTGIENINEETLTLNDKESQVISTKKTRFIDSSGNKFLIGVIRDITNRKKAELELKENEEKFSKAFESNLIGKAILDKEKKIIEVNQALANIVGFKRENMLGNTAEEIGLFNFDSQKNQENEEKLWRQFSENGYASNIELEYLMQNGKHLFILISLQALQLNNEDHVLITILDITEKKTAEAELEKHRTNLEELVEIRTSELEKEKIKAQSADLMKSAFLATMSHELRTPMNSIIGFTGILLKELAGPLNEEQKKQLAMVKNSGEHLLGLINDVLDISKIEAGKLKVSFYPFDYLASLERTLAFLLPQASAKGLNMSTEIAEMEITLVSDERRVEQILLNLLSNAIKFSNSGTILIKIGVKDNLLITQVIDQGIGISKEDLMKLFMPFIQLEAGLSRSHDGTGLGLAICKNLIEKLGGTIHLESELGKGSNFTFKLPLVNSDKK